MLLPKDFTLRMHKMLKDGYDAFVSSLDEENIFTGIRLNTLKKGCKEAVLDEFGSMEPVKWCENGFYVQKGKISGTHPYHMAGLFYFQEPSAMCAAAGIEINEGDRVLDLCAAPGGKSTQAAVRLNGSGLLVANEIIKKRAAVLSQNIERFGLKNVIVTNEDPSALAKKYPEFFDKIIVDAPCSGEGMFRKEPQAVTEWSVEHVKTCAVRQRKILDCAVKMLRPGGEMAYSTCTFSYEENEENALYLINEHNMTLVEPLNGEFLSPAKSEWAKDNNDLTDLSKAKRIFPHLQRGEGHFVAVFKKPLSPVSENAQRRVKKRVKKEDISDKVRLFKSFEKEFLNTKIDGEFVAFGDNLYLKPEGIDIDTIRVVRCGLHLGVCKKNRFEPSLALALALDAKDFKNCADFDPNSVQNYLRGHTVESDKKGWCAVTVNGFPLGWAKGDGRILKNHYPKYLRLN